MLKLISKLKRRYILLAALAVLAGAVLGLASVVHSAGSPPPIVFAAVPPNVLSANGIDLTAPQGSSTTAAGQAAAATASRAFGGATVRESHFAHCVDPNLSPAIDQDCWAISLDPSGFHSHPPMGQPAAATYLIVLVDSTGGEVLHAQAGNS